MCEVGNIVAQVCRAWANAARYEPLWQARLVQQGWSTNLEGCSVHPLPEGKNLERPAWSMYTLQVFQTIIYMQIPYNYNNTI